VTRFFIAVLITASAFAQPPGSIDGPVLGFVFDPDAAAVRPLLGVPGSATLGAPLATASGLHGVVVQRSYALGIDDSGAAVLASMSDRRALPGASGVSRVFVSPRGTAAAAYRSETGSAEIYTGLPDSPRWVRAVTLDSAPAELSLSDDGDFVAAIVRTPRGPDSITWMASGMAAQTLYRARRIESITFLPGGATALIAEPAGVKRVSPAFGTQPIAEGLDGVLAAAGTADGSRVVIATQSGVVIADMASSARIPLGCACTPNALAPLRGGAVFRLNRPGDGPLWLLDADAPDPRILFVAAPAGGVQ